MLMSFWIYGLSYLQISTEKTYTKDNIVSEYDNYTDDNYTENYEIPKFKCIGISFTKQLDFLPRSVAKLNTAAMLKRISYTWYNTCLGQEMLKIKVYMF